MASHGVVGAVDAVGRLKRCFTACGDCLPLAVVLAWFCFPLHHFLTIVPTRLVPEIRVRAVCVSRLQGI